MDNNDPSPYQSPDSDLDNKQPSGTIRYTGPIKCPTSDGLTWIRRGFELFKLSPGAWVSTMIVGLLLIIILSLIPVIGVLISQILTYVWVGGLMIGCQAAYDGSPFDVKYLFAGFSKRTGSLIGLSVLTGVLSMLIMLGVMGSAYFDLVQGSNDGTLPADADATQILLSFLIAMALMIPVMMAVWFAPVLIVLQNMPMLEALKASFIGCSKNMLPFLIYGIVMFAALFIAALPLFLGLLVVVPVMYASMFTSYQHIFLTND